MAGYRAFIADENRLVAELRGYGLGLRRALAVLGIARSTWQDRIHPRARVVDPVAQKDRAYPNRICPDGQAQIRVRISEAFGKGLSVYSAWFDALDAGDPIASLSSWHRLARAHLEQSRPQRRHKTRRAAAMPQFEATGPNQVWCWDITKLPGRYKGEWLNLYLIIDAFSRLIVGWRIEHVEDDAMARDTFATAIARQAVTPRIVHSDRGASMMSKTLAEFYAQAGITRSKNRPRVSNDNPFAESWFKTAKYGPSYPGWFRDIDHARHWATTMIENYNTNHKHSGLEGHTPQSVHDGSWIQTHHQRQATLDQLAEKHPERYRRQPQLKTPFATVTLNKKSRDQRLETG